MIRITYLKDYQENLCSDARLLFEHAAFIARICLVLSMVFFILMPISVYANDKNENYLFLGNYNIPPMIYIKNAKPTGIVVDLTNSLASRSGINIEIRAGNWAEAQSKVLNEEADALLQINRSKEREKLYDFSDNLLESRFCIFRKNNRIDIQDIDSLFGYTVGVEGKGYPKLLLQKYPQIKIKTIDNWKVGFELINSEEIDAIIVDRWVGEYVLAINRIKGIAVVDKAVESIYSSIAVKKGNKQLLAKINMGLEKIREDGSMQKVLEKWSIKETVYLTKSQYNFFIALVIAAMLIALLLLAVLFYMYRTKKINKELQNAINEIKTLRGIIPVCSYCHNVRNDEGAWDQIESYISKHSEVKFSHGICPKCLKKVRAEEGLNEK